MDKKFQIGEIARFFDMPASTFRYWEDKGILHPRKKIENQYREYAIEDLMTISDVIFYKNLGLELNEIRGMDAATPEQHGKLFSEKLLECGFKGSFDANRNSEFCQLWKSQKIAENFEEVIHIQIT